MSILDTTIVNVALDTLATICTATISQIQWVATGYLLALAAVIPLTGLGGAALRRQAGLPRLDRALHARLGALRAGRIEHVADPLPRPAGRRRRDDHAGRADDHGRGRRARTDGPGDGRRVMPAMLAPILGPVVGGLILQQLHWSWIFFVNVPIGVGRGFLGARMLPRLRARRGGPARLGRPGLLAATSLPLIVYGLSEIGTEGSFTAPTRGLADPRRPRAVPAFVLARAAHRAAAARPAPLCEPDLRRRLASPPSALGAALFGAMILVPLYYQQVRGESVDRHRPSGRSAGARDALVGAVRQPPHRALRRRPGAAVRRLAALPSARSRFALHRRRHLDRS